MKIPVTVIRHSKERLSKCSLEPLKGRPEITFLKATNNLKFDCTGYILLDVDAPELSPLDVNSPILLLDSTWRLLSDLKLCLIGEPIRRSLPHAIKTAYPRISKVTQDPLNGLASVEALYACKYILGENDPSLLDGYYWRKEFLSQRSILKTPIFS